MTDPKQMNVLELLQHEKALSDQLPLLDSDSKEILKAEFESTIQTRSEKVDRFYAYISTLKENIALAKEEQQLIKDYRSNKENKLKEAEQFLRYVGRMLPKNQTRISGNKYQFLLSKRRTSAIRIDSSIDDWSEEDRNKFCIQKEIETITKTVVRSLSGEVLEQSTVPKTKTEIIPNEAAIRNAHQNNERIPEGVYVYQPIAILPKRIVGEMEVDASDIMVRNETR